MGVAVRAAKASPVRVAALGVTALWLGVVYLAPRIDVGHDLRTAALFGHLAALVLGFGAVLSVEWVGLLWLLRRRPLAAVLDAARTAHLPIWLGMGGLAGTGVLLHPDVTAPLTQAKLLAVLVIALNGVYAGRLEQRLATVEGNRLPPGVVMRLAGATGLSQLCWWAATIIGFINARH